jgi:hypothetical protein
LFNNLYLSFVSWWNKYKFWRESSQILGGTAILAESREADLGRISVLMRPFGRKIRVLRSIAVFAGLAGGLHNPPEFF